MPNNSSTPSSRWLAVLLLASIASSALVACHRDPEPPFRSTLRRGISAEPSTLDPAAIADAYSLDVERDLYEGLTAEAADGTIIPGVASSWSIEGDGTVYTFHLRPDARWSDGRPVTATNFVNAWRRVVDPKTGSPVGDLLRVIRGAREILAQRAPPDTLEVTAVNPATLQVTLEMPAPYFLGLLAHSATYPILSDELARNHDPKHWVSNGAYILTAWEPGTTLRLARNLQYWDLAHVAIPRVEYHVAPDDTVQLRRYQSGELDVTDTVPPSAVPAIRQSAPSELLVFPVLITAYYGFNLSRGPLAANQKLRQSLAMAVDRKRVVASLGLGQAPAYGLVPSGTWNYTPQEWSWKSLSDDERIKQSRFLFMQAGYSAPPVPM